MKFLISEILLCLLAASILGLIIGWLCKAAFARDKLKHRDEAWRRKLAEREESLQNELKSTQQDAGILKSRVQSIEGENQSLNSSLEANKSAVHKAHIEVQQLSKRQRDTQERLQKIITEKDREISRLQQESASGKNRAPRPLGFSSRKPANPPKQQAPAPTSRPAPAAPTKRTPPPAPAEPYAGGRPNPPSGGDSGYKPGTQTIGDDFDKTQALRGGVETTGMDAHDRTAANRPMGSSNDNQHSNTGSAGLDQTTSVTNNPGHETRSSQTDSTNYSNAPDGVKKRSLWDKVKSSVTKKPE